MAPMLHGREQRSHEFLYWEFFERGPHEVAGKPCPESFHQAVRMGDWKAIRHGAEGALELYDLRHDAPESHDLASTQPEVIAKITAYLQTARTNSERWPFPPPRPLTR